MTDTIATVVWFKMSTDFRWENEEFVKERDRESESESGSESESENFRRGI